MTLEGEIIQALYLTDEDMQTLEEGEEQRLADSKAVVEAIINTGAAYDQTRGEGAFRALKPWEKMVFLFQTAALNGYHRALQEVREAQDFELTGELPNG